ncbi:MAG: DUF2585 family protein [Candidatus Ryanbacteria bacterium]|nr:DUF2585 family protein [Candidatus Ryanbacteria bacterium]
MPLSISVKALVFISIALIAIQGIILFSMDRTLFCKCGDIGLWGGVYLNSQMSQQFADIYTPSHFLHGVGFFWILWLIRKKIPMSLATMLAVAIVVEAGWEILENTEFIINRYRSVTISFDYYGDSIFNSLSDTLFMIFGFLFAWRAPAWASVGALLVLELGVLWLIRDNLALNILMLVYPLDAVRIWQAGG